MIKSLMAKLRTRGWSPVVVTAYGLVFAAFVYAFANFYIPGKGFTYLVAFGSRQEAHRIDALKNLDYYVQTYSYGYDAQYYVQIAMDPSLRDPQLPQAIDSLAYRARRILFPWIAYVMGAGKPEGILNAYVLLNGISWFLLAFVLWWWFPPASWNNLLRWAGVLFSLGMCVSVRNSLVDGPSLLIIAGGIMLLERGRPGWATFVLAVGGLGKETNLLGASSLLRPEDVRSPRRWPGLVGRGILLALPLVLWLVYIQRTVGTAASLGARNFDWPLVGYGRKWVEVWSGLLDPHSWAHGVSGNTPLWSALLLVALMVQVLFLVLRPAAQHAWWRVGIVFAILCLVLGGGNWDGYPAGAARVLLPMQLAFNVLVPTGRRWLPVLVLGNLSLLIAPAALGPPGISYQLHGPSALINSVENGRFRVLFGPEWYGAEIGKNTYWRWCSGSTTVDLVNPHAYPVEADMDFKLAGLDHRQMAVSLGDGSPLWSGEITNGLTPVKFTHLRLAPGRNVMHFTFKGQPVKVAADPRTFAFNLRDWVIRLAPAPIDGAVVTGSAKALAAANGGQVTVRFPSGWHEAERTGLRYWRWSDGPAEWIVHNPHDQPIRVDVSFYLNGVNARSAGVTMRDGRVLWQGEVSDRNSAHVELNQLVLPPGDTPFQLRSNLPPVHAHGDIRLLDLCLRNLVLRVTAPATDAR